MLIICINCIDHNIGKLVRDYYENGYSAQNSHDINLIKSTTSVY